MYADIIQKISYFPIRSNILTNNNLYKWLSLCMQTLLSIIIFDISYQRLNKKIKIIFMTYNTNIL